MSIGDKVGPYEITGLLGVGGMGEVYRAHDARLGRDVAIKTLAPALAGDAEYMARFRREAQVLASLTHPNIAVLYGIEGNSIVMELVDGPTLAETGPLPTADALEYARQIADALEAAHEKGIIHRDLKPGNIKITPDGHVKVLDFGLAKTPEARSVAAGSQDSPTLTVRATQAGIILGTAAYMAPEQAAGKPVDRRADIWSFGVVLYEMLTGARLFKGESISETLADVLRADIDFSKLPSDTPLAIRTLLARCLDRKLKTRLQWIGEARVLLESPPAPLPAPTRVRSSRAWIAATAFCALAAVAIASYAWYATRPTERQLVRWSVDLGPNAVLLDASGPTPRSGPAVVLSPDGSRIVFVGAAAGSRPRLYTRRLDQATATPIEGTDGGSGPFFSPDGRWLAFFASGRLRKTPVEGGTPIDLCPAPIPINGSWGTDGTIIAALSSSGVLYRVPEAGGAPTPITKLENGEVSHRWVTMIPRSNTIVFAAGLPGGFDVGRIVAQRLDTGERRVLRDNATFPRYLTPGYLTFLTSGTLYAGRFNPQRMEFTSDPVPVLQDIRYVSNSGGAQLAFSNDGAAIYRSGAAARAARMVWASPNGEIARVLETADRYATPKVSPDGRYVAYRVLEGGRGALWIYDLAEKQSRRLTFESGAPGAPIWTPDSRRVAYFASNGMYWTRVDGVGKPVLLRSSGLPTWFARDGKSMGFLETLATDSIWSRRCKIATIEGDPEHPQVGSPQSCFASELEVGVVSSSRLSPDGRWIAYASFEAGELQAFVRSFPDRGGKWQISSDGGASPQWSADGRQIFFVTLENRLMVTDVRAGDESFASTPPRPWLDSLELTPGLTDNFSLDPKGNRVLAVIDDVAHKKDTNINLLLNFHDEIERRLRLGLK